MILLVNVLNSFFVPIPGYVSSIIPHRVIGWGGHGKVEEGAIRIITKAAQRAASVEVVRLCARTLCNFAGEGRARPKMWDRRTSQVVGIDVGACMYAQ